LGGGVCREMTVNWALFKGAADDAAAALRRSTSMIGIRLTEIGGHDDVSRQLIVVSLYGITDSSIAVSHAGFYFSHFSDKRFIIIMHTFIRHKMQIQNNNKRIKYSKRKKRNTTIKTTTCIQ